MATNKIYYTPGTIVTFRGAGGGDILWTMQNEGTGKGRISNVWDRGEGSLPARYLWRCTTRWVATPTLGDCLRLYLVTAAAAADATLTDGGLTIGDAELTVEDPLFLNCQPLGGVTAQAIDKSYSSQGIVAIYNRYVALASWNASGTKAMTNTVTDHVVTFTPIPDDIQAAT